MPSNCSRWRASRETLCYSFVCLLLLWFGAGCKGSVSDPEDVDSGSDESPEVDAGGTVPDSGQDQQPDSGREPVDGGQVVDATTNHAPTIETLRAETDEDEPLTAQLVAQDEDGDTLTYALVTQPAHGNVTIDVDSGSVTYTPATNFTGEDSLMFSVSDGKETATGTVVIQVRSVNDAPTATGAAFETVEDTAVAVTLSGSDIDTDTLTYAISDPPDHGTLSGTAPALTYTPASNYAGSDSFQFTVSDGTATSAAATVQLTVTGVNDPPTAGNDAISVAENARVSRLVGGFASVLHNDTDPESDSLTVSLTTPSEHGSLTLNPDGTFTYTHDGSETTTDGFTYSVCDDAVPSACSTATVSISITPVNDAPVAVADTLTVEEDGTVTMLVGGATSLLANDTDPENGVLTIVDITQPTYGALTLNPDGTFEYVNWGAEVTTDSFSYLMCDDGDPQFCDDALVTIQVTLTNDPPAAYPDSFTVAEGGVAMTLTGGAATLLGNDTDAEPGVLRAKLKTSPYFGQLTLDDDGTFIYQHNGSETTSDSFSYEACDSGQPEQCGNTVVTITITPVNDAPLAEDDSYTLSEGATFNSAPASVLDDDSDPESDVITLTPTPEVDPEHGTLTLNADGTFTYVHDGSETTSDSFAYEICDPSSACSVATVTLNIQAVNDLPVAAGDTIGVDEGAVAAILAGGNTSVLDNDTDAEPGTLTATIVQTVMHGTLTLNPDGTFEYTHDGTETTSDSFTYSACDASAACDEATVDIIIGPVNETPLAADDEITVAEGGTATELDGGATSVLANDMDLDLDVLTVQVEDEPLNGTLTLNADGTFEYTHDGGETTTDEFTYVVCDDDATLSLCAMASVFITITSENDLPAAVADAITVEEGGTKSTLDGGATSVLANDTDAETGSTLTVSLATGGDVSFGTLTLNADGTFSYVHDGSENFTDEFTYRACDDGTPQQCAEVAVSITITPVNDPPVAEDDAVEVAEGESVSVLTSAADSVLDNDEDPDSSPLTVSVVAGQDVQHGTLSLNSDGTFTYTNDGEEFATDSFTYEVCDAQPLCDTATVTITIANEDDSPVANDDSFTVTESGVATTLTGGATSLLANDTDEEGVTLTAAPLTSPAFGSLVLSTNGTFTYTHNGGQETSDSFTYEACDASTCDEATVNITITPVNDEPEPVADAFTVAEGETATTLTGGATSLLANDLDPDLDTLTAVWVSGSGPEHGTVTIDTDGTFEYEHDGSETFSDQFSYQACDASLCAMAVVSVTITPVNDAPLAMNDAITVTEAGTATVLDGGATSVSANDTDPDSTTLLVTVTPVDGPDFGTLTLAADGTFEYIHDGSSNFEDEFVYQVCDNASIPACSNATVEITITSVNDAPVAVADTIEVDEGATVTTLVGGATSVLANDTDEDSTNLTATLIEGPDLDSSFALNPNGTFSYTHDGTEVFTDSFSYQACDDANPSVCSSTVTVTITIEPVNEAPVVLPQEITVAEGGTAGELVSGEDSVLTDVTDPESGTLTASLTQGPDFASSFVLNADGTFSYTHDGTSNFSDSFEYSVCDDGVSMECTSGTVTITISPVNDAPIAMNDSVTVAEGATVSTQTGSLNVLTNDTDEENNALEAIVETGPDHASAFMLNVDGSFNYTNDGDDETSDSFTYRACDNGTPQQCSDPATVSITITPVNDVPIANAETIVVAEGATIAVLVSGEDSVLDNDTDDESATLTATVTVSPTHATAFTLNSNGTFSYAHDGGESTEDFFTYIACEASAPTSCSAPRQVNITITPVNDAPVAGTYSYPNVVGNTLFTVATGGPTDSALLLMTNDTDIENDTLSITAASTSSTQGGTVAVNLAARTFTYLPPAGYVGSDSFTYTVSDNGTPVQSVQATVNLTVAGMVWYVDSAASGTQTGRSSQPFATVTLADAASPAPSSTIYVKSGAYSGVLTLAASQQLIGAGVAFAPTTTVSFADGARPTIGNANTVVTLTSGNVVRGVSLMGGSQNAIAGTGVSGAIAIGDTTISATNGAGISLSGGASLSLTNLGTITARSGLVLQNLAGATVVAGGSGVSIAATNGPALDILGGSMSLVFGSLSSTSSSTFGVSITSVTGSIASTTTTITNPATHGLTVQTLNSGSPQLNFGTCNVTAAGTVSVATGDGYRFDNNLAAGNITFAIGVDPATANGRGLYASATNNLNITSVPATISATSGPAIDLRNTTGSANAPDAWRFNAVSSTNSTEDGVHLENLNREVSFNGGTITGSQRHGVYGASIAGLVLIETDITNVGNATEENAVTLSEVSGNVTFEGNVFSGMAFNGLQLINSAGSVDVSLTDVDIIQNDTGLYCSGSWCDGSGVRVRSGGGLTFTAEGVLLDRITGEGIEIVATSASSSIDATITDSDFTNGQNGDSAIEFGGSAGDMTFLVSDNVISNWGGHVLVANVDGNGADVTGTIEGNTITANNLFATNGIRILGDADTTSDTYTGRFLIQSNTINDTSGAGIWMENRGSNSPSAQLHATILNNTSNGADTDGFRLRSRNGTFICATYSGNTAAGAMTNGYNLITSDSSTTRLYRSTATPGSAAAVQTYMTSGTNTGSVLVTGTAWTVSNSQPCLVP